VKLAAKLLQIAGALTMAAGVASCSMAHKDISPILFLVGGLMYAAGRLGAWLLKD
jgi:hypothetical protein